MVKDTRRTCYTCGKKYHYCGHCDEFKGKPSWMNICCCDECHDFYVTCANYNLGKCSANEARAILDKYDPLHKQYARENMAHTIQSIYAVAVFDDMTDALAEQAAEVEETSETVETLAEAVQEVTEEVIKEDSDDDSEPVQGEKVTKKARRRKAEEITLDE